MRDYAPAPRPQAGIVSTGELLAYLAVILFVCLSAGYCLGVVLMDRAQAAQAPGEPTGQALTPDPAHAPFCTPEQCAEILRQLQQQPAQDIWQGRDA